MISLFQHPHCWHAPLWGGQGSVLMKTPNSEVSEDRLLRARFQGQTVQASH